MILRHGWGIGIAVGGGHLAELLGRACPAPGAGRYVASSGDSTIMLIQQAIHLIDDGRKLLRIGFLLGSELGNPPAFGFLDPLH